MSSSQRTPTHRPVPPAGRGSALRLHTLRCFPLLEALREEPGTCVLRWAELRGEHGQSWSQQGSMSAELPILSLTPSCLQVSIPGLTVEMRWAVTAEAALPCPRERSDPAALNVCWSGLL